MGPCKGDKQECHRGDDRDASPSVELTIGGSSADSGGRGVGPMRPSPPRSHRARLESVGQFAQQNERTGRDGKTYRAAAGSRKNCRPPHQTDLEEFTR